MKKSFFLLFLMIAMGCSKSEVQQPLPEPFSNLKPIDYLMSMDEIRDVALISPFTFSSDPETKSNGQKTIKNVIPLTDFNFISHSEPSLTRSDNSHERAANKIYIVNYDNDQGYVIISADNRLPEVLGYSDNGNITDDMANPGLKMMLEELALMSIIGPGGDSIHPGPDGYYRELHSIHSGAWSTSYTRGPMVSVAWKQDFPYNIDIYCPLHGYDACACIGCTNVAVAQILSKWGIPHQAYSIRYNRTYSLEWERIRQYPYLSVAPIDVAQQVYTLMQYVVN